VLVGVARAKLGRSDIASDCPVDLRGAHRPKPVSSRDFFRADLRGHAENDGPLVADLPPPLVTGRHAPD
jgi:hypothetical protein